MQTARLSTSSAPALASPLRGRFRAVRVAALYDVHGNLRAVEAVLVRVAGKNIDTVESQRGA